MENANLLGWPEAEESPAIVKQPEHEPIPGYRLIEPLGRGGFGEVWKCEAPGGLLKAIKFVYGTRGGLGDTRAPAEEELQAIQRIKVIRHPFILSMERVESINNELVIVMELADKNLHDVLRECQKQGQPGIPRPQLLSYLAEAAEALDLMNHQYGLQHLDIKPGNLFLVYNHAKIGDFGLVSSLRGRSENSKLETRRSAVITPLYASPELFLGSLSPHCDQYSLAIVYQELLTGTLPFNGKNSRQLLIQHSKAEPHLGALCKADCHVIGRALSKDPFKRFPTCTEFIEALKENGQSRTVVPVSGGSWNGLVSRGDLDRGRVPANRKPAKYEKERSNPGNQELTGYQFVDCLGCGPFAEIWKVRTPEGRLKLARFLSGFGREDSRSEAEAIDRLRQLAHPALLPAEVLRHEPGRLILLSDYVFLSLWNRLEQCQSEELAGIPRTELLGYLRTAAETLDHLNQRHGIQHLGLNPRTLLLDNGRLRISDFGLVQLLWFPAGQPLAQINGRYSSPELLKRQLRRGCDQYSLALIYAEMLTGLHPFHRSQGQSKPRRTPSVEHLLEPDQRVILRALHPDPQERWPSCLELVRALEEENGSREPRISHGADLSTFIKVPVLAASAQAPTVAMSTSAQTDTGKLSCDQQTDESAVEGGRYLPPTGEFLLRKFFSPVPVDSAQQKLVELCQQFNGRTVQQDSARLTFCLIRPRNLWQQCVGRQPGIEVLVELEQTQPPAPVPIEVTVQLRPIGCRRKHAMQLLAELGSPLLDAIRLSLQISQENRLRGRCAWNRCFTLRPILRDGTEGEPVECQGRDISATGIGFYLPKILPTTKIALQLPQTAETLPVTVTASIVSVQRCGDTWYEVAALFLNALVPEDAATAS